MALWKAACPTLEDFATIRSIEDSDVAAAGATMARLLQVAPHGLERWKKQLGPGLFPLVAAYVYQIYADDQVRPKPEIRKPGGFFCYVAREVFEGGRDLPLELMAMQRKRLETVDPLRTRPVHAEFSAPARPRGFRFRAESPAQGSGFHGLMRLTPMGEKSATLRVTMVMPWTRAQAAMKASRSGRGSGT